MRPTQQATEPTLARASEASSEMALTEEQQASALKSGGPVLASPPDHPTAQGLRRTRLSRSQRSLGNQAVQRQIQRDGTGLPPVPNYQLTPPTLQMPGPRRPSLLGGEGPQLHLDPQIEAQLHAMQIRNALSPATIQPLLTQLPIGPIRLPPPNPLSTPTPAPAQQPQTPSQPQPRVGETGEPPREGSAGDVLKAIVAVPAVEGLLSRAGDQALMQWQQLRLGGQVSLITVSTLIAGGAIAGIAATPDARRFVLQQIDGVVVPVPGLSWMRAEFNTADDNLMFGLHIDMSRFLPSVLGFGPGSPEAMGGPPRLEDAPGPPTLRRSLSNSATLYARRAVQQNAAGPNHMPIQAFIGDELVLGGSPTARIGRFASVIHRFGSEEHRQLGDAASGDATLAIDLGDGTQLTYGELVALAGDYFGSVEQLRALAASDEGKAELRWTRWWALHVGAEPSVSDAIKQRVRDRYYTMAANNISHFSAGGTAASSYEQGHIGALSKAFFAGAGGQESRWQEAMVEEAFAQHYLSDMFAAGHVRTPRQELKEWYQQNYPNSIGQFVNYLAAHMTRTLDSRGDIPGHWPNFVVQSSITNRINTFGGSAMASFSLGDIVSLAYHDFDNAQGLRVVSERGPTSNSSSSGFSWTAMGDSHLADSPITRQMATLAMQTSLDELQAIREAGIRLGNGACLAENTIQLEMQTAVDATQPFQAMSFVPHEEQGTGNVVMNWHWGSLNPELREAIDHAVKHDIVTVLRGKVGDVPETQRHEWYGSESPTGSVVLHVRDAFVAAVDHLAELGIGAIETAISASAAPAATDTMGAGVPMDAGAPDAASPTDAGAPVPAGVSDPDDERDAGMP